MSLARTALRIGTIEALNADPVIAAMCGGRVFDSRIDELDAKEPVPLIVVYTEDDGGKAWSVNNGGPPFDHHCDLVLEIAVRGTTAALDANGNPLLDGNGNPVIDLTLAETDREIDASLDLLEQVAVAAVTVADTPQAVLLREAVARRTSAIKSMRFASADSGGKIAMRLVTLTTELKGWSPDPLNPPMGTLATLPEPLRSIALSLSPTSSGYATCAAIATRFAPVTDTVLGGVDMTIQPFIDFDPANPPSPTGPYPAGVVVADPIAASIGLASS